MLGFLIVLLSSIVFSVQNVTVRVLFTEHLLLGLFLIGGYVTPTLGNSFLLMFMRMLLVVPLMAVLAGRLYPHTWREIRQLVQPQQRSVFWQATGCGVLMFLYLVLLYIAIGLIPTGIAMTLFFTYPVFTALLSWRLFGDRPSLFRWIVMGIVLLGSVLTMPQFSPMTGNSGVIGVMTGLASGVTYACYTVVAQKCFENLHPVPFTWISFATTLVLSGLCLIGMGVQEAQGDWTPLWIGGLLSGIVTFIGHLLNNIGIRWVGATAAAIIGATNPALTVLLAWFTIHEVINDIQLIGVLIATLGVAMLSAEKRSPRPASPMKE